LLLQQGARVDAKDVCGKTALHYICGMQLPTIQSNPEHHIFFGVNHSFIAAASTAPWLLTAMTAGPLMTESTQTAMCSMASMMIKASEQQGIQPPLVDAQDRFGSVPLMTAITTNVIAAARLLCDFGANVHIKGRDLVVFLYDGGPGLNLSFLLPMNDG
jgi:ankyrin repeat protein